MSAAQQDKDTDSQPEEKDTMKLCMRKRLIKQGDVVYFALPHDFKYSAVVLQDGSVDFDPWSEENTEACKKIVVSDMDKEGPTNYASITEWRNDTVLRWNKRHANARGVPKKKLTKTDDAWTETYLLRTKQLLAEIRKNAGPATLLAPIATLAAAAAPAASASLAASTVAPSNPPGKKPTAPAAASPQDDEVKKNTKKAVKKADDDGDDPGDMERDIAIAKDKPEEGTSSKKRKRGGRRAVVRVEDDDDDDDEALLEKLLGSGGGTDAELEAVIEGTDSELGAKERNNGESGNGSAADASKNANRSDSSDGFSQLFANSDDEGAANRKGRKRARREQDSSSKQDKDPSQSNAKNRTKKKKEVDEDADDENIELFDSDDDAGTNDGEKRLVGEQPDTNDMDEDYGDIDDEEGRDDDEQDDDDEHKDLEDELGESDEDMEPKPARATKQSPPGTQNTDEDDLDALFLEYTDAADVALIDSLFKDEWSLEDRELMLAAIKEEKTIGAKRLSSCATLKEQPKFLDRMENVVSAFITSLTKRMKDADLTANSSVGEVAAFLAAEVSMMRNFLIGAKRRRLERSKEGPDVKKSSNANAVLVCAEEKKERMEFEKTKKKQQREKEELSFRLQTEMQLRRDLELEKSILDVQLEEAKRTIEKESKARQAREEEIEILKLKDLEARRRLDRARLKIAAMRGEMICDTLDVIDLHHDDMDDSPDAVVAVSGQQQQNSLAGGGAASKGLPDALTNGGEKAHTSAEIRKLLEEKTQLLNIVRTLELEAAEWQRQSEIERKRFVYLMDSKARLEYEHYLASINRGVLPSASMPMLSQLGSVGGGGLKKGATGGGAAGGAAGSGAGTADAKARAAAGPGKGKPVSGKSGTGKKTSNADAAVSTAVGTKDGGSNSKRGSVKVSRGGGARGGV